MVVLSKGKYEALNKISTEDKLISALAIDQRGSLRKMIESGGGVSDLQKAVETFKTAIAEELTSHSSAILLDPEYGLPASSKRKSGTGLLLAYEETGYDTTEPGRMPDLLPDWSVKRIKKAGADAVKFLLYYNIDEDEIINARKQAFTERIGSECLAEDMPFFLEILTYDSGIEDVKGKEYAKVKPRKVNQAMKVFSQKQFNVDVLKVEVPVNMNYVEGFGSDEIIYTQEEAASYFKEQDASTNTPYIYLSAGVTMELFKKTLIFASESGAQFNGVLCGRATWKESVNEYVNNGYIKAKEWLSTQGTENIKSLNQVTETYAVPWSRKITLRKD